MSTRSKSLLLKSFAPTEHGSHEYVSRDGRRTLKILVRPRSLRDLHAGFFHVAREVADREKSRKGIVAAWMATPSNKRMAREWQAAMDLFKPSISRRMALLIVRPDRCVAIPDESDLVKVGEAIRAELGDVEAPVKESRPSLSRMFFEVFKVLLRRSLMGLGPIGVGEVMRRVGCSYPTVADAVRRLERTKEVERRSKRSVELADFPRKTWGEVLALSDSLRRSRLYADTTGKSPDPKALLRRLGTMKPDGVAVGGVSAGRHYDSRFDLHGLPRLDLTVHGKDVSFVRKLDPALKQVEPGTSGSSGIVLAVHNLSRKEPLFEPNTRGGLAWADPVETLLDLHELRLMEQAEHLIRRLHSAK